MNTWSVKKDSMSHFVSFDFEFFDEVPKRVPYGAACFTMLNEERIYKKTWGTSNLGNNFIDKMSEMCDLVYDDYAQKYEEGLIKQYELANEEVDDEELKEKVSLMPLNIVFGAHSGFKADFPLIRK